MKQRASNYLTTIAGLALAGLLVVQEQLDGGVALTDPKLWIAVGVAVLGLLAKDQ